MNRTEAEEMLAELQRGRPSPARSSRKHLDDLDARLEDVMMWCRRYADFNAPATSLRRSSVSPNPLSIDRWTAVETVIKARRAEFHRTVDVTLDDIAGRLLAYFPDAPLGEGAADSASRDFFDIHHAPPFGTWLGYFEDVGANVSRGTSTYLIAWVPRLFVNDASTGIKFSPKGRIAWLNDTTIAMRHIAPHLRLSMLMM
jgi:hypothetical protein